MGNRRKVINAMRFSDEPEILSFLKVWDAIPKCDRTQIPLEAVMLKAQVSFKHLMGAYVVSFRSIQMQKSALRAMALHPDIVDSTGDYAKLPGGDRDRRMLHEAVGFLPTSKGASINFNFPGSEAKMPEEQPVESDTLQAPEVDDLFPLITEREESWQQARTKLLEEKN
jgi:hypothetical protein